MKKIFTLFAALAMVMSMSAVNMTGGEELYLTPNSNWLQKDGAGKAPRFAIYVYGSNGDKWASMTAVEGENNLYKAVVPNGNWTNVIFCRMNGGAAANGWGNKYNQTGDLTYNGNQNWYTVKEGTWDNGGGTWALYAPEAPKSYKDITITIVANATPKIHYWDGGDKMVGTVWENLPEMTATGEANTYSCTIKDVDEAIGVKYLIKVGEVQSADQQAFDNVTVNFKDLLPQVVLKGTIDNWGDKNKMTVSDDYLSASITLPLTATTYEWKLTVDGNWFGGSKYAITRDKNSIAVADNGDGNGKLTADLAGDYVFTYTYANQTLTVTYPAVKYNVTVTAENGTVTGAGEYEEGATATLTATAADGYEFVNWTKGEEVVSTENPYTFTVTANVALVANFKEAEPEYQVIEDEITNFVFDMDAWPMVCQGGPSATYQIEVYLVLTEDADGTLSYEDCSVSIMGTDATFIEGTLSNIDVSAPSADAVLRVQWNEEFYELHLAMSAAAAAEPTNVLVTNAVKSYDAGSGALKLTGLWEGVEVFVEIGGYEGKESIEYSTPQGVLFETPDVAAFGNEASIIVAGEDITVVCNGLKPMMGNDVYNVTITTLSEVSTSLDNLNTTVAPVKMIENGQLIIVKDGVQYNAQGAILK